MAVQFPMETFLMKRPIRNVLWLTISLMPLVITIPASATQQEDLLKEAVVIIEIIQNDEAQTIVERGTGIIVSPEGHILTAFHIIQKVLS